MTAPGRIETDVLVLGSGIAGLSYAIKAAEHGRVTVLTKKEESEGNTNYAQGGIAAVMDPADSFAAHITDTLEAGAGLCDREAVELLVRSGPERVRELIEYGVRFTYERDHPGRLSLAREGGHSARRIVRADDLTGRAIERGLLDAAARGGVTIHEHYFALDLWVDEGPGRRCVGALAVDPETGEQVAVEARVTFLATGGCGQVYRFTTNPRIATGDG
ncbi:MAG TPA: FAD-dependent oxidoreductase, partial [Gemmatimonadota bacterium]|nr:FAD-dependent oxidoreductase [Gemmatimonadota bacterium]